MRAWSLWSLVLLVGCGRDVPVSWPAQVTPPAEVTPPSVPQRVHLTSSYANGDDGFRFADQAVLTTRTIYRGVDTLTQVLASDGGVVTGDAARTDLQLSTGRFLGLGTAGNWLCVMDGRVASLAQVDPARCTAWVSWVSLQVASVVSPDAVGMGIVVRTERDGVFRIWVARSAWDGPDALHFVDFDFAPVAACSGEGQACVVREDCCNSRHSCLAGACGY